MLMSSQTHMSQPKASPLNDFSDLRDLVTKCNFSNNMNTCFLRDIVIRKRKM